MIEIVNFVKNAHIYFDTPLTVEKHEYVRDALSIINKRAHKCVILVDEAQKPISIFTPSDLDKYEQFMLLGNINKSRLITGNEDITPEDAFNIMHTKGISALPIVNNTGKLV